MVTLEITSLTAVTEILLPWSPKCWGTKGMHHHCPALGTLFEIFACVQLAWWCSRPRKRRLESGLESPGVLTSIPAPPYLECASCTFSSIDKYPWGSRAGGMLGDLGEWRGRGWQRGGGQCAWQRLVFPLLFNDLLFLLSAYKCFACMSVCVCAGAGRGQK